ncbi:MAG: Cof-type HAD-IIB family hydrolase [Candidatus Promineifilaceae bacterium]
MTNKLVAIDVDGTLLSDQRTLSDRNVAAIRAVLAQGVRVVLATGRRRASCLPILEQLGLRAPGLFVQGLHIADEQGNLLRGKFLSPVIVRRVVDFMHSADFGVTGYGADALRTERLNRHTQSGHIGSTPSVTHDLSADPQHLLITHGDSKELAALRPLLDVELRGEAQTVMSSPYMLEVLPLGGLKGEGLLWLAAFLGVSAENTIAIGNAENDLDMLHKAGFGIAVANAEQIVKDSADVIVASNNDNGVAEALERFVLGRAQEAKSIE